MVGACASERRRARARRFRARTPSTGSTPIGIDYRGVDRARDSAERPGHRRADGARHPRPLRHRRAAARFGREPAPADRGDEARVRRCAIGTSAIRATMTVTPAAMLDPAYLAARARADRSDARAGLRARRCRRAAARSTSAPPTQRGMIVSLIQSNYMGFGSGVVVPGHRHQLAEPRRRVLARARPSERSRPAASGRSTRSFPAS